MDFVRRLRLNQNSRIALVGSGGKTTLMFQLASEFQSRVILTTTTHMSVMQLDEADQHISVLSVNDIPKSTQELEGNIILFTGSHVEADRVRGPAPDLLLKILKLADEWDCPLIIEADGARQLPIKAPADHEPAIPEFINTAIVCVGLSGLGQPLNNEWVHRPERFSSLVGIPEGSEINSEHLGIMLSSNDGGLKGIPDNARRILFINQIDSFPNWRTLHRQMNTFLENYHAVAFAVLEDQMLLELHERIAGIVLAAGGSSRFGTPKQLLDWQGRPLINHIIKIAQESELYPLVVVVGSSHNEVIKQLDKTSVLIINNPDWESGQSTSVRAGIESLPDGIAGAVFILVDQPFITPELIKKIRSVRVMNQAQIIHPQVNSDPANPVFFDSTLFDELSSLVGDTGGRSLFDKFPPLVFSWHDERIQLDIDTPEDYQNLISLG